MSKEVVVFTKRSEDGVCPGCKMLKRKLDSEGIPYKEIPYDPNNEEHVRIVKGAKFSALPVTFPNGLEDGRCRKCFLRFRTKQSRRNQAQSRFIKIGKSGWQTTLIFC